MTEGRRLTRNEVIGLLKEMAYNCRKGTRYDDPRREDKCLALQLALAAFMRGGRKEGGRHERRT